MKMKTDFHDPLLCFNRRQTWIKFIVSINSAQKMMIVLDNLQNNVVLRWLQRLEVIAMSRKWLCHIDADDLSEIVEIVMCWNEIFAMICEKWKHENFLTSVDISTCYSAICLTPFTPDSIFKVIFQCGNFFNINIIWHVGVEQ